ncbi:MAG: FKBP-type peptidyl-prolyl cis-trans isomerase [Syntrophotaleaceae bacterium]
MKSGLLALMCLALVATGAQAQEGAAPKTEQQKGSYSLGYKIGLDFRNQIGDLDADNLVNGMKAALGGKKPAMSEDEMRQALTNLQQKVVARQQEQIKQLSDKNLQEGKTFLQKNRQAAGVKTTASGLQYKVLEKGTGKKPGPEDMVTVHYRGTFINGTEFDSSYKRNEPATFKVNGVIPGWTQALQMMQEGAKWKLFIPSDLAYGERGAPGIPPNSTLVFDVELQKVEKKK